MLDEGDNLLRVQAVRRYIWEASAVEVCKLGIVLLRLRCDMLQIILHGRFLVPRLREVVGEATR